MKITELIKKYKDLIPYLFFGVCTTIVNIVSYWILAHILNAGTMLSTVIAWIIAVTFAYVTNRKWVFHSEAKGKKAILKEIISFFICRLATGIVDVLFMWVFVDIMKLNDIIIKFISNVIVIILNYVASKVMIFNKNSGVLKNSSNFLKQNKKYILNEYISSLILIVIAFIFMLKSPLNPFSGMDTGTDSSVFKTVGFMMDKGYMPYRDTFDHKGPYIYLLNWLGIQISYYRGIWGLELINMIVTVFALYKIARLKCDRKLSLLAVLLAMSMLFEYFNGGNFTEEYALPLIAVSLYIFLNYLLNNKISKFALIICGVCFSGVLLLRPNMISLWVVFCIAIFIDTLIKKNFKDLKDFIIYFLIGMGIVLIPVLIWLTMNNAIQGFWNDYIVFNRIYSSAEGSRATIVNKWNSFFRFFNNPLLIAALIITCYLEKKEKKLIYKAYIMYIALTLILICISGMSYEHYGMILVPIIVFPFANLFEAFKNMDNKNGGEAILLIVAIYLICMIINPTWKSLITDLPKIYSDKNKDRISYNVREITNIIKETTTEEETISVYGNWDIIYVISQRKHATHFSYQFPIATVLPDIGEQYIRELQEEKPKIIVIQENRFDTKIEEFLMKNNYKLIWKEKNEKSASIYKLQ